MTLSAEDFDLQETNPHDSSGNGPTIEDTPWGYIIRASDAEIGLRAAGSVTGRFVGAFLLMAACIGISLVASLVSVWGASGEKPLNVLRYE